MMNQNTAGADPDRLPWLPDELPGRSAGRSLRPPALVLLAVPAMLGAVGGAFLLGAASTRPATEATPAPRPPLSIKWEGGTFEEVVGEPIPIEPEPVAAPLGAPQVAAAAMTAQLPRATPAQVAEAELSPLAPATPEADSSFSCRLAATASQLAICRNADLLKLDQHLSLFYTQAFSRADAAKRELLLGTRDAFASWREACRSESCIRGVYAARIREVSGIMAGHIQHIPASARARQASDSAARPPRADASFSCRLARTSGQVATCRNEELLKLDQHLSLFYTQAFTRSDAPRRETLLRTREQFAAARDQCQSERCLKTAYLGRIREVATIVAGDAPKAAR